MVPGMVPTQVFVQQNHLAATRRSNLRTPQKLQNCHDICSWIHLPSGHHFDDAGGFVFLLYQSSLKHRGMKFNFRSMVVSGSIYCQLGDYMPPTTFYGNQKQPLIRKPPHSPLLCHEDRIPLPTPRHRRSKATIATSSFQPWQVGFIGFL